MLPLVAAGALPGTATAHTTAPVVQNELADLGDVTATPDYIAIPVLRERPGGADPFLHVVRPAAFGLTVADFEKAGLPVVPAPGPQMLPWDQATQFAVPFADVLETFEQLDAQRDEDSGTSSASLATASTTVPLTVFSDTSNLAVGDQIAVTAWDDTRTVFAAETSTTFDVYRYQADAVAFPNDPAKRAESAGDDCSFQRYSEWEEQYFTPALGILLFSDGTMYAADAGRQVYGIQRDGDISRRLSRGDSWNYCSGATKTFRSPAYIPRAYVSTDYWWGPYAFSEKQAPSHWAAHELAHMFGMSHTSDNNMADCWGGDFWHGQHKTLEASTGEDVPGCVSSTTQSHHHYTFSSRGRTAIRNENTRTLGCLTNGWCTTDATPSAPLNLVAFPGSGSVTLTWNPPAHNGTNAVMAYCVFKGTTADFLETELPGPEMKICPTGTATSYTWTGLTNGTTYYFYVRAANWNSNWFRDRDGPRSNIASTVPGWAPDAPVLNTITASDQRLDLSWSTPANNGFPITEYRVYRGTCSGCETYHKTVTGTSTFDTGLVNGTAYFYQVRAFNSRGLGAPSNEQAGTPRTTPGAPVLNTATAGDQQIALTWSPPASNGGAPVTGYSVYRGTTAGGTKTLVTSGECASPVAGTSCTDRNLVNGTRYYYQVRAINSAGTGAWSNELSAVPSGPISCSGGPANNCFASPISVTSSPYSNTQSNAGATTESGEPAPCGSMGATVWYRFTAPASGTATVSTIDAATTYDTVVAAYTGSSVGSLNNLACDDDTSGRQSQITFACTAGATYQIQLGGYLGATGTAALSISGCGGGGGGGGSFTENWEGGLSGWTVSGSGAVQDCTVGQSGCSLRLSSTGSAGVNVSKSMSVGLASPTTASVWFRGSSTTGDTDSSIGITFDTGQNITLALTEPSNNNGLNLYGPNGSTGVFHNWAAANTWYQAVFTVNPTSDTANVQIKNSSGTTLVTSTNVSIPTAATSITAMNFHAVKWGGSTQDFLFDTVSINGGSSGGGLAESWESGLSGWTTTGNGAMQDCTVGQSGCSLRLTSTDSAGVSVTRNLSIPLGAPTTASFWFRGSSTTGDTDSSVTLDFNTGNGVTLALTEPSNNNGLNFYGPSGNTTVFHNWATANTWYQAVVTINASTDTASVQIKNGSGTVLATSGSVSIPATATTVSTMGFHAVKWGGSNQDFLFDTISIA